MQPQIETFNSEGEWPPRKTVSRSSDVSQSLRSSIAIAFGAFIEIVSDGAVHRFDHPEKRQGNKCGWYVCHARYAIWGDWATGERHVIIEEGEQAPGSARKIRLEAEQQKRKRTEEKKRNHARAASMAQQLWQQAIPAEPTHRYLSSKEVKPHKLRQHGGALLIPMFANGVLVNLQRICPEGTKRFLHGGRVTGAASLIGSPKNAEIVYLVEGWSTGATIYEATGRPVVVAMNCGNLLPVARNLRAKLPGASAIIIAADNDHRAAGNPGLTTAKTAAQAIDADLTWPRFPCSGCGCSDFNDLATCKLGGQSA